MSSGVGGSQHVCRLRQWAKCWKLHSWMPVWGVCHLAGKKLCCDLQVHGSPTLYHTLQLQQPVVPILRPAVPVHSSQPLAAADRVAAALVCTHLEAVPLQVCFGACHTQGPGGLQDAAGLVEDVPDGCTGGGVVHQHHPIHQPLAQPERLCPHLAVQGLGQDPAELRWDLPGCALARQQVQWQVSS